MQVVLIGPGLMGAQIGCEYALGGHHVTMVYRRRDKAEERLAAAWQAVNEAGLASDEAVAAAQARMMLQPAMELVASSPDLVVESIVEDEAAKHAVLREAAERWPQAILASNTSAIPITRLGEGAGAPERIVGTHYWNPPLLMPLVEVITGERTDPAVIERVMEVLRGLGKRPVRVRKDVPGFVWNRLQLALLREAVWIVENGVADPEVVDAIVRDGLARRWWLTGPFETVALGGPETFTRVAAQLFPVLSCAQELHDVQRWLPESPEVLAETRRRRDAGLIEALRRERRGDRGMADTDSSARSPG
ncbi:MAG: 3-hydroxyacyl-CoA dehydrogenase [Chloroflexota bacterium]